MSLGDLGQQLSGSYEVRAVSAAPGCTHSVCDLGQALDPSCDPCVPKVCERDSACCSGSGNWEGYCIYLAQTVCGATCN